MLRNLIKLVGGEDEPRTVRGEHLLLKRFRLPDDLLGLLLRIGAKRIQMFAVFGQPDRHQRHRQRVRRERGQIMVRSSSGPSLMPGQSTT